MFEHIGGRRAPKSSRLLQADDLGIQLGSKRCSHLKCHFLQGEDASRTRQWFKALQFYGLSLGHWRKRRNGMANIMIYGTSGRDVNEVSKADKTPTFVPKSSSLSQLVDLAT